LADNNEESLTPSHGHSFLAASGILLSRVAGLVRESVIAFFFGSSAAADALKAAFRIPNLLQNLFGEGVLSASFIPVYANLLAREEREKAERVAGAVAALLMAATSILVLLGVLLTPWIIDLITPGFSGAKRQLCIELVRILFPGAGLMVWSAWCLGILNSHHKFFLSYVAPVVWNAAIIGSLLVWGSRLGQFPLAKVVAWASVAGSALQVVVQLPLVLKLLRRLRLSLSWRMSQVREVVVNFVPVFFSRGVFQISSYVDALLASFLPTGALASFTYAQMLYILPVSLFGMSVSAVELPAMSKALGSPEEVAGQLHQRLNAGLRRIAFFIIPSTMAFLVLGNVIAAAVYQRGQFSAADSMIVWAILAGSAVGLLATTFSRLYVSTFYALRDTRTPLRYAILRVVLSAGLGYLAALHLPALIGIDRRWGVAGLGASASICGWIEFILLRRRLSHRISRCGLGFGFLARLWLAAALAAAAGWGVRQLAGPGGHPIWIAAVTLGSFALVYLLVVLAWRIPEAMFLKNLFGRAKKK